MHNLHLQLQQEHPLASADAHGTNTWAKCNLHKAMQLVWPQTKPTDAQKIAQKIAAAGNKESSVLLAMDILILTVVHNTQLRSLQPSIMLLRNMSRSSLTTLPITRSHVCQTLQHSCAHEDNELNEGI
jgi:hypothetical protein